MRTTIHPQYVTGLLESAGSFTFNRGARQLTVVFAMRAGVGNRSLLEALRRFFGGGRIYRTRRDGCFLRVNRPAELMRIVEHLDAHPLRGDKRNAFRIWREMVLLRAAHTGSRAPAELESLAGQLADTRRKSGKKGFSAGA